MLPAGCTGSSAGGPVATSGATVDGAKVQVELNELRVGGQITTLTFTVRNTEPADSTGNLQVASNFGDGVGTMEGPGAYEQDYGTVDGVYLLDGAAAKRYLPGRTAKDACICTGSLSSTFIKPGSSAVFSAVYAALPAGVGTVDLVVPNAGTVAAVPVNPLVLAAVLAIATPAPSPTEVVVGTRGDAASAVTFPVEDLVFAQASADGAVTDLGDRDFTLSSDVLFAFDRATLNARAKQEISRIAGVLTKSGTVKAVSVTGFTDDKGSDSYNRGLSRRRAQAVQKDLASPLNGTTVKATGQGEKDPIASNKTTDGRKHNRRSEIRAT